MSVPNLCCSWESIFAGACGALLPDIDIGAQVRVDLMKLNFNGIAIQAEL